MGVGVTVLTIHEIPCITREVNAPSADLGNDADVLNCIRRELRRITDIMVPPEVIAEVLRKEVIKRETLEGEDADSAVRMVMKQERKAKGPSEAHSQSSQSGPTESSSTTDSSADPGGHAASSSA